MRATHNKSTGYNDRALRKALVFERALHCWDRWLHSVAYGRKVLRFQQLRPPLEEMVNIAKKALAEMEFPSCTRLEVYWLCCVFADYKTEIGFTFDKLVLPDWFSSPFRMDGFRTLDFKGKRIYPPQVWDEADVKFWFKRDPAVRNLPTHTVGLNGTVPCKDTSEIRAKIFENFPNNDFILVLSDDHPVREYIKRWRPTKTMASGETLLK